MGTIFSLSNICVFPAMMATIAQGCAWTGFLIFWIRSPTASNRIRSEVFFAIAGARVDFVFAEKTLLVLCFTYIYAESNRSRIACVMLVPDLKRIRIESLQNRIGS